MAGLANLFVMEGHLFFLKHGVSCTIESHLKW